MQLNAIEVKNNNKIFNKIQYSPPPPKKKGGGGGKKGKKGGGARDNFRVLDPDYYSIIVNASYVRMHVALKIWLIDWWYFVALCACLCAWLLCMSVRVIVFTVCVIKYSNNCVCD